MPIKIDRVDDGLPISVVIPMSHKRKDFFENFVLPMIEINNPVEIIINDNLGSAPKKRNDGLKKSTQPYVFFCDDDIILPANYLEILYNTLIKQPTNIGYVYTGYHGIVLYPHTHPMGGNFVLQSMPFNVERLMRGNYISPMTLFRKDSLQSYDETMKRLEDWELFVRLAKSGVHGVFVDKLRFHAYYLDEGITSNNNNEMEWINYVRRKHGM